MLDHPARIDAHVVGHHVAGQPDAARPGPVAEVRVGGLAAEVVGDPVVVERVGRGDRVGVAAHALDPLRRRRPLPQPDQPQPGDAPAREPVELLVGDRVERPDVAAVACATAGRARRTCSWRSARGGASRPSRPRTAPARRPAPRERRASLDRRRRRRRRRRSAGGAPRSSSAMTPIAMSEPVDERVEGRAEQPAPVLADVAELAGERRRAWRAGARRSSTSDARRRRLEHRPVVEASSSPAIASA